MEILSCRVSQGLSLHGRTLPGNLNYGLCSVEGCDSLLGESLATWLKTLPSEWFWSNSKDENMTWSLESLYRNVDKGLSSCCHLLIRNRWPEPFPQQLNFCPSQSNMSEKKNTILICDCNGIWDVLVVGYKALHEYSFVF